MTPDQETAYRFLVERPAEYGRMLGYTKLTGLHNDWIRGMVLGRGDATTQAHRGSYKTTAGQVGLTELMLLRGDLGMMFIRKTDDDVKAVIQQVSRNLKQPVTRALYHALTGRELKITVDTATAVSTSAFEGVGGTPQLLGIGTQSSITGKHADFIWTDDIVNLTDRRSRAERERVKAFYAELHNIVNRGGRIVNTGTPWHPEDAFTVMPTPRVWDCYHTGLMSREDIERLRHDMPPSLFAANYELRHIAAENALFKTAPVFITDKMAREVLKRDDAAGAELLRDGIAHIDAGYEGEDYTALTCARRRGDWIYGYGRIWRAHVDTVLDAILAECERLMCAPVYCESNGDKAYLAKEIRRKGYQAGPYHEKQNKYLKISTHLHKWWDHIAWLDGTDPKYLSQIQNYTEDAEHDDAPDSAASVCRYLDNKRG